MAWDADDSREIDVTMDGVANQSRYFIEQLPSVPQMGMEGVRSNPVHHLMQVCFVS